MSKITRLIIAGLVVGGCLTLLLPTEDIGLSAPLTEKQWVAKDIEIDNKVIIVSHKSEATGQHVITIYRDYRYVDDSGETMPELIVKRIAKDYTWESLPQDLKDLLIRLDEITRAEALKDAGME